MEIGRITARLFAFVLGCAVLVPGLLGVALSFEVEQSWLIDQGRVLLDASLPLINAVMASNFAANQVETFLQQPLVAYGACGLGLLFLLAALAPSGKKQSQEENASVGMSARMVDTKRKLEQRAQALEQAESYAEAALAWQEAGELDRAFELYLRVDDYVRAARVRNAPEHRLEAAELFQQGNAFDEAASLFSAEGEYHRAAECYAAAGQKILAAEMLEKAGDYQEAGSLFVEVGFPEQAAQSFVRAEAWGEAARALRTLHAEESSGTAHNPKKDKRLRKIVLRSAQLFEKSGDDSAAMQILEEGRCFREAAEVALRLDKAARAAELFIDAGDPLAAAEALKTAGDDKRAAQILGEYHRDHGELERAAEFLTEAGDYATAGEIYVGLEQFSLAGDRFEQADNLRLAAEMYSAANEPQHAARCHEQVGQFEEAAECWQSAGDAVRAAQAFTQAGRYFEAGQYYHEQGLDEEAIRELQQVEATDPNFIKAAALLGEIFRSKGMLSMAITKMKEAIGDRSVDAETVDAFYALATVYEVNGDLRDALALYERIRAHDFNYKDVDERIESARDRLRHSMATEISGPGVTSVTRPPHYSGSQPRYEIIAELGRGGMGIVYKAKDQVLDRVVAYKVLPESLKENAQALKNFLREAKSAAQLNHPGIVTVYDAGEQDDAYYIAMEYVDGTTLKEVLRRNGVLPVEQVRHVLIQVSEALAYAHSKHIVHRDIKAGNIMWTRSQQAKIMDFGLAKFMEGVREHTTMVAGTPYYMSPEQTLGQAVDHRSDLYSLGVTLFELATGGLPFVEGNVPYHHVHTEPPDPCEVNPQLPIEFGQIILRCLVKQPEERYSCAEEILEEARASITNTQ